jgi:predicted ATPase
VIARLERAAGFERNDASEAKLEKLSSLLGAPSHDESDLQLLAELLSIPVTDHLAPLNWSPQRKKEKTLEALLRQLETLSREERVFAVYEDVQWLDPSSRELLDMTVERVADLPVLLVITFRPDFQPPWAGQPHVSMVNLGRLSKREAAALAALVASHRALPDDITAAIVERTDGIPLFVEELTKAVLEASSHDENGRETIATAPLPTLAVPVSLHASLIARLDRLGTLAKEVAQIGAVIGREFSYELLAAVAQRSDHELRSIVGKLSDSGLVFCRGTPPRATLLFKHALVRDAAYASLLRSLRQQIHARIASALEDQRAEIVAVRPELLAHHFAEAGLLERAVSYRLEAGQQAAARSAITEAVMQLRNGLGLLARLPENTWGQRRELDLQIALGRALIAKEGWVSPAAGQAFERARQLCEYLNPLPQVVVRVVNGQYATRFNRGEFARARQLAEEMLQLGVAHRDVTAQVLGYRFHGQVCQMMGEFTAARANLERSLALYDPSRQAQYAALSIVDAHVLTHYFLSTTMRHLGYPDQARALEDAALAEARQLGHPLTLAQALSSFLWTEWGFQTEQILMEAAEELASLSAERGFAFHIALANALRGWCLTGLGRADEGLTLLADALETIQARGQNVRFPFLLLCYADGLGRSGQFAAGLERLDQAMQLIEATQGRYLEAPLHELRGRLLISMRERFAAEAVLRKAIEVAKDQNSKMLELHASTSLARLWRDQGKHGEAHNLLASIHGWFTEGFDTRSLKEAKALLEELD